MALPHQHLEDTLDGVERPQQTDAQAKLPPIHKDIQILGALAVLAVLIFVAGLLAGAVITKKENDGFYAQSRTLANELVAKKILYWKVQAVKAGAGE